MRTKDSIDTILSNVHLNSSKGLTKVGLRKAIEEEIISELEKLADKQEDSQDWEREHLARRGEY